MTLEQFKYIIGRDLMMLQAKLATVEYATVPEIYIKIKNSIDKMISDLEKEGLIK